MRSHFHCYPKTNHWNQKSGEIGGKERKGGKDNFVEGEGETKKDI